MAEQTESGGARLVEEATGVAASFVRTLGLTDIVFGSFLLYWLRVALRATDWPLVFPGTGYPWVDVVLLAAAAALVGKVLSLVVSLETAVLDALLDAAERLPDKLAKRKGKVGKVGKIGYRKGLSAALDKYLTAQGRPVREKEHDLRDLAEAYVAAASQERGAALERMRVDVSIAHAGALVTVLYAFYFVSQRSVPRGLAVVVLFAALVLFVTGILAQLDYVKTLRDQLEILLHRPPAPPEDNHGSAHRM
jgi:hypothetical protein